MRPEFQMFKYPDHCISIKIEKVNDAFDILQVSSYFQARYSSPRILYELI